jgi:hypothetical protein
VLLNELNILPKLLSYLSIVSTLVEKYIVLFYYVIVISKINGLTTETFDGSSIIENYFVNLL